MTVGPVFIGSEVYRRAAFGANHPLAFARVSTVMELCQLLGWFDGGRYLEAPTATLDQLARFHDPAYIAAVAAADKAQSATPDMRERYGLGTMENPIYPGLMARAASTCGGAIAAAKHALTGGIAFHPAGGTHHGFRARARGFCYFNDPVLALYALLDAGLTRIFYVDLDAHHGDGVEEAFKNDPSVLTLSIHEEGRWPHTGALADRHGVAAMNIPVPRGFNDSELDFLIESVVVPLGERLAPQAVVITCGADNLKGDPLSKMELSNGALWRAVSRVVALAPGAVVLGGGGYHPWNVARGWTGLWGVLSGQPIPDRLPPAAESILRSLSSDLVDDEDADESWFKTLADPPRPGAVRDRVRLAAETVLAA